MTTVRVTVNGDTVDMTPAQLVALVTLMTPTGISINNRVAYEAGIADQMFRLSNPVGLAWTDSAAAALGIITTVIRQSAPGVLAIGNSPSDALSLGLIKTGGDVVGSDNGAMLVRGSASELVTLNTGGVETQTAADLVPANSELESITVHVDTAIAGATSFTVKPDGGDPLAIIGTATTAITGVAGGSQHVLVPIGKPEAMSATKRGITITANQTASAGKALVTVFYRRIAAPSRCIVMIGDSKTAPPSTWPDALNESLKTTTGQDWRYSNKGVAGSTVALMLASIATTIAAVALPARQVSTILMNLGVNDSVIPENAGERVAWEADYIALIDALIAAFPNARCYLMRPWKATFTEARADGFALGIANVVAARSSVASLGPDERDWLEGGDNGATMTYDGTHYSVAGNTTCKTEWLTTLGY